MGGRVCMYLLCVEVDGSRCAWGVCVWISDLFCVYMVCGEVDGAVVGWGVCVCVHKWSRLCVHGVW